MSDSIERFRLNGNGRSGERHIDEQMEEDDILARELNDSVSSKSPCRNQESQGIDSKLDSNGNTTIDTNGPSKISKPA